MKFCLTTLLVSCYACSAVLAKCDNSNCPSDSTTNSMQRMTNGFLRRVFPADRIDIPTLNYLVSVVSGNQVNIGELLKVLLKPYAGYTACIVIGLLMAAVVPLLGLALCCIRVCSKRARKSRQVLSKHTCSMRFLCTILLFAFSFVAITAMIIFLINSRTLHNLVQNKHLKQELSDRLVRLDSTLKWKYEQEVLGVTGNITTTLIDVKDTTLAFLNSSQAAFKRTLAQRTGNNRLAQLGLQYVIESFASETQESIKDVYRNLQQEQVLQTNISRLLKHIASEAAALTCCQHLQTNITNLVMDFNITEYMGKVSASIAAFVNIDSAASALQEIPGDINNFAELVDQKFSNATNRTELLFPRINRTVSEISERGSSLIVNVSNALNSTQQRLDSVLTGSAVLSVSDFLWRAQIIFGFVITLTVSLHVVGLVLGLTNRQSLCSNKLTGSKLLIGAVTVTFISFSIMMIFTSIVFIPGSYVTSQVCWSLQNPHPMVAELEKRDIRVGNIGLKNIMDAYSGCMNGESLMDAIITPFSGRNSTTGGIQNQLNASQIRSNIGDFTQISSSFVLIKPVLNETIAKVLSIRSSDFNFTALLNRLSRDPFGGNTSLLIDSIQKLNESASVTDQQILFNISQHLQSVNRLLTGFNTNSIARSSSSAASKIESFQATTTELQGLLFVAQENLTSARLQLNQRVESLIANITSSFSVVLGEMTSIKCDDLAAAIRAALDVGCVTTLNPVNAIWFSLGWCLMALFAAKISAVLVIRLLQSKSKIEREEQAGPYIPTTYTNETVIMEMR